MASQIFCGAFLLLLIAFGASFCKNVINNTHIVGYINTKYICLIMLKKGSKFMNGKDSTGINNILTPKSYWLDSTYETNYPTLEKDIKVDIVIIGGGITGITTALLLKEEGYKVALIEADKIGQGTTGHSTAYITSQHDIIYSNLISTMGIGKAKQYADANERGHRFHRKHGREI